MVTQDIYQLLGLEKGATVEAVKKTFRRFARMNHPDLVPGDARREAAFKKVTAAYHHWKLIQGALSEMRQMKNRIYAREPGRSRYSRRSWTA